MKKIIPVLLASMLSFTPILNAEEVSFTATGSHEVDDTETFDHARDEAFKVALRDISQQAIVAIQGKYSSMNQTMSDDVLEMVTASMVIIDEKKYNYTTTEENRPVILVKVKARVDVDRAVEMTQKMSEEKLNLETSGANSSTTNATELPNNWWKNNTVTAVGNGFPPDNAKNPGQAKVLAKQAALLDGYRRLAEQVAGIQITADQTMVEGQVQALIKGAKIISEEYDEFGNCRVELSVPIYGVSNSIANAVFQPVVKEDFPKPSKEFVENNTEKVQGNYTGLIIDCSDLEDDMNDPRLNAVLSPIIQDSDNRSIYSYDNLDRDKVISQGMVGYSDNMQDTSRAGDNPLIIKASSLDHKNSTPILSKADADRILMENQSSHFMDNCNVVLVSTRGIRDSYVKAGPRKDTGAV